MALRSIARFRPVIETAVLLVCDVQERFRPLIFNMNTVIAKTELLNNVCHTLDIPCIISEQNPRALGATVPEITRHPNTFIYPKSKFSMCTEELLPRLGDRKQVILCGIESHVCVFQTTLDLLGQGRDVFLVGDAVSSQRPYDRAVALQTLQQAGAVITTAESLIFSLLNDASHPRFREISGMIKKHNSDAPNEFGPSLLI